jgi:hypothetical protein
MRALLMLLTSCTTPLAFDVSPAFDAEERAQIAQAAADWNARTVPAMQITLAGGDWRLVKETPPGGYDGARFASRHLIMISPDDRVSTYSIALHEFGHAIGLEHTTTGVMHPVAEHEFTPEVMAECARVVACVSPRAACKEKP